MLKNSAKFIRIMTLIFSIVAGIALLIFLVLQIPSFGKAAKDERLQRIKNSPNYRNGQFQNRNETPQFAEGYSGPKVMWEFTFKNVSRRYPSQALPGIKTDLLALPITSNVLVWFGHSSYYMQIDGKRFLVDPVFSGHAAPIAGMIKAYAGTDLYTVDDLPPIDFLLITHDHYDHLDYKTIRALNHKTTMVVCGLGVGAHFEHWGYAPGKIMEKDWDESIELAPGFMLYTLPARHFSGRSTARNNTLWLSMVLQTPNQNIYIGGDSGYDDHFAEIGEKFGPFDLAILENGQYNEAWRYIHTLPNEVVQAAKDLKAQSYLPVHSSKFALGRHSWDEPLIKVSEYNKSSGLRLITPMIGEPVMLSDTTQTFGAWWEGLD